MPRFDPRDPAFQARRAAVDLLFDQFTLIGASGSHLEAQLMARAAASAGLERMIGSCVTPDEVIALIRSRPERCLLVMVDSIAADHGEALVDILGTVAQPPLIVLMVETHQWMRPHGYRTDVYPFDRVDVVLHTHSFGSGALIQGLASAFQGHRYVDPALLSSLSADARIDIPQLTTREQETLNELARGLTNRQIARRLGIAESTAREYTRGLLSKLQARNRTMVVRHAFDLGLLQPQNNTLTSDH